MILAIKNKLSLFILVLIKFFYPLPLHQNNLLILFKLLQMLKDKKTIPSAILYIWRLAAAQTTKNSSFLPKGI